MADQAITALPKKTYSGSSKIEATDYLLGIDSAEGYQMLIQDLGEYIINKVTTSLAGSNQTLVAAISALNSKKHPDLYEVTVQDVSASKILKITRNISRLVGFIIIRGVNSGSSYVGIISAYNGGSSRTTIVDLQKSDFIGALSIGSTSADDYTINVSFLGSISSSITVYIASFNSGVSFDVSLVDQT